MARKEERRPGIMKLRIYKESTEFVTLSDLLAHYFRTRKSGADDRKMEIIHSRLLPAITAGKEASGIKQKRTAKFLHDDRTDPHSVVCAYILCIPRLR